MTSRVRFVAAAAVAVFLAVEGSARAEGIVIADGDKPLAVTAFGDGSWDWTGRGVIAGFQTPVRVDITGGGDLGGGFFHLTGVVTDSPGGLLDGWRFDILVNAVTGDYRVDFSFGGSGAIFFGTGMVQILP